MSLFGRSTVGDVNAAGVGAIAHFCRNEPLWKLVTSLIKIRWFIPEQRYQRSQKAFRGWERERA